MRKTTIYLPDALKARLERVAAAEDRSEADVIRAALADYTGRRPVGPRAPLVRGGAGTNLAERVDELLARDFGRR